LEFVDKRYSKQCNVGSCDSKSHDEWFKCSPAEAKQIIQQWQRLSQSRLYDPTTRQLEDRWKLLLPTVDPYRQEKLKAGHLLEATENRPGSPSVLISDALKSMSL
jgi:hypothetical protein